jgi:hypothetical protein
MWVEAANSHLHNVAFFTEVFIHQTAEGKHGIVARVVNCPNMIVLSDLYEEEEERLNEILQEYRAALEMGHNFFTFNIL